MLLKFKKHFFKITKRNVKVYKVGNDYKFIEYNFGEREPKLPYNNIELVYYAEMYNGVLEHINLINAKIIEIENTTNQFEGSD